MPGVKTYIISSFIPNAEIEMAFVEALKTCADHKKAEILLIRNQANTLSDLESPYNMALEEEVVPFIVKSDKKLNENLYVSSYASPINIIDPLSGMESDAAKMGCFILGFPRHRFKTVPRMLRESLMPRAIWCTGSISQKYYKGTKSGRRVSKYHIIGALVVEIHSDKKFVIRQLEWDGTGFYDLNYYYTPDRIMDDEGIAIEAISLGDDHAVHVNPYVVVETIKLFQLLKPKKIFHHDTLDNEASSHHLLGKNLTKATIGKTIEQEGEETVRYLSRMISSTEKWKAQHYQVASNHPEHLVRYVDEGRYIQDPFNYVLGHKLAIRQFEHKDCIEWFLTDYLSKYVRLPRLTFLKRKDTFKVKGIEMADHGDEGASGSKGSTKEKGIVYDGNSITAHTHAPEIGVWGNYVNVTMTFLSLGYTKDSGSSSWLNTHTAVYKNGKRTHLHIIL
jgi:hypothetical protein